MASPSNNPLVLLPMEQTFDLSAKGTAELNGHATTLNPAQLELLIRLDGALTLGQVRQSMPQVSDDRFAAAFKALQQRGLVRQVKVDRFDAMATQQLSRLQLTGTASSQAPRSLARAGFSVGLTWRRARAATAKPSQPYRAVVVEDDPVLSRMIECFLALEGFEVCLAANRAEVVAALSRRQVPDVVLLDVMLPDADGFQVLSRLRAHPRLCHVPALMLTGRATREAVLEALAGGADGYLTKPFDPESLMFAVRCIMGLDASIPAIDPWANPDALETRDFERTQPMPMSHDYEPTRPMGLPNPPFASTQPGWLHP
ncbi:response regulator [Ramlibacter sp.]|uniref:response regulator transcription factor n=1 Tax=Ramlibacter sp. TaxID=1917967 RepID=UPI002D740D18|nr:response regulator [Ramlibacter sp.]HYD76555.1 response regulator [Ramlibacter sp.]